MSVEVVMPQMGESITEGTVSKWLKAVGDKIEKDEPILEISTDKVDAEVPSPAAGTLLEIRHQEGETVEVGTALAVIGAEGEARAPAGSGQKAEDSQPVEAPAIPEKADAAAASANPQSEIPNPHFFASRASISTAPTSSASFSKANLRCAFDTFSLHLFVYYFVCSSPAGPTRLPVSDC